MINLEDGHAVNMGDTIVIQQTDENGSAHSVVVSPKDIQDIQAALLCDRGTSAVSASCGWA